MKAIANMIVVVILAQAATAAAQQPPTAVPQTAAQNPFDLSAARQALGDNLPTVSSVALLEKQAQALVEAGDCKGAVDALDKYARQANALSNLIARSLKPYCDGSFDERKAFVGSRLAALVPIERLGNDYKAKRNRAMVMQAECFVKLGDSQKAAATFYQALGLIDINDSEWWDRARNDLFSLLQVAAVK